MLGHERMPEVVQDLADLIFRSVAKGAGSLEPLGSATIMNNCVGSSPEHGMGSTVAARTQAAVNVGGASNAACRQLR